MIYSQHYCTRCRKYFNADMTDLAAPGSHYTRRVVDTAVRLVVEDGLPYRTASWNLWRDHRVFVPYATIQNWVEAGGKKAARRIDADYLDWALSDFSGYIAADELYDGPFCVLSIVDNRTFKRLSYQVLDHDPDQHRHRGVLPPLPRRPGSTRRLSLKGITTDGSSLYPEADRHGLRRRAASTLHVPCPQGSDQGGALRRGQAPQGPGGRRPQAAAGPSRLEGGAVEPPAARSGSSRRSAICSSIATCSSGII